MGNLTQNKTNWNERILNYSQTFLVQQTDLVDTFKVYRVRKTTKPTMRKELDQEPNPISPPQTSFRQTMMPTI